MKYFFHSTIAIFFVLTSFLSNAQISFSGKIINDKNENLTGASVVVEKTFLGTFADENGKFLFKNLKTGIYTVKFAFLGYEAETKTFSLAKDTFFEIILKPVEQLTDEVVVSATRASHQTPVAYSQFDKKSLEKQNAGKDIPYLLSLTPSLVSTSDAGTGIGYSNFRIRGTDANRINVTVNGIPLNDPESQYVYWVDLPDLTSSVDNLQVQRGVGTSTNGAATFGATINLQTTTLLQQPSVQIDHSFGSFNTQKYTFSANSGLLKNHFTFDTRLSKIYSDGYVDRAFADLKSWFISGAFYNEKTLIRVNIFSGNEKTYQAWYGIPKAALDTNRTFNPYSYKNEIDNYEQTHYQAFFSQKISENLYFNSAFHYTKGKGYYEQFKENQDVTSYGILIYDPIFETNLIRQLWLDNDFYGFTSSLQYRVKKNEFTLGGSYNNYDGDHFGEIIWAEFAKNIPINYRWYFNVGKKTDFNIFAKANFSIFENFNIFGDVQYRHIDYSIEGIEKERIDISQSHAFDFLNPKTGIFWKINNLNETYFSFGLAQREPNRDNFIDNKNIEIPKKEILFDYEVGYKFNSLKMNILLNFYFMNYENQLVLTGEINDIGNAIMRNVPKSYRTGIEIAAGIKPFEFFEWTGNITFSKNKIKNFVQKTALYDTLWNFQGYKEFTESETDISFSPNIIAANQLIFKPLKNFEISLLSKFVDKQFIDNTASAERQLDSYFVNDLQFDYSFSTKYFSKFSIQLKINNLLNEKYETNAWVYRILFTNNTEYVDYGYFPQALRHYLISFSLKF